MSVLRIKIRQKKSRIFLFQKMHLLITMTMENSRRDFAIDMVIDSDSGLLKIQEEKELLSLPVLPPYPTQRKGTELAMT